MRIENFSFSIGHELLLYLQLGNGDCNLLAGYRLIQLQREIQRTLLAVDIFVELQRVVFDIRLWHADQHHVAGNASVVPPVEDACRHVVLMALVVYLHNHKVLALLHHVGHVETERRETTFMPTGFLAVDIDDGLIVDGTEVQQQALALDGCVVEVALHPYRTLIEKQLCQLCVPVARHMHGRRLVEVVLYEV